MKILIVEDHEGIRLALEVLLELEGYSVHSVDCGEDALVSLQKESFDLVLLDLSTNGITADEFMSELARLEKSSGKKKTAVCVLSASQNIVLESKRLNAEYFYRKPFDHTEFLGFLERVKAEQSGSGIKPSSQAKAI